MIRLTHALLLAAAALGLAPPAAGAAGAAPDTAAVAPAAAALRAPTVEKVDPPNWWVGHTINPVRVLIRGRDLAGARLECPRLTCRNVRVNAAGTYVFADVTIPGGARPGSFPLTLRTAGGSAPVPFRLDAPLAAAGRFQGFDANDVMYLIMPDRFANGDTTNDDPAKSRGLLDRRRLRQWHGGDIAGVRQRLPYLKSLGITALWLNPIYDNTDTRSDKEVIDGDPATAYHGYHASDFYAVDERFGDVAEARRLVDDAHAQGIKVIWDMVANHTSPHHPWVKDSPTPTWFNGTEARHQENRWQTWTLADPYSPPAMREQTLNGWFVNILPDLNQDDPEVARYIIQNTLWWMGVTGADGIRQDTWPYAPRRFWRDWMAAINRQYPRMKVVGEVLDGDPALVSFFQGGRAQFDGIDDRVQSLFDFPVYYPLRSAFARGGNLRDVAQMISRDRLYPNPDALVTVLGLHDVNRFMGEPGATTDGLRLAFTFLLTARGIPLIYYGDEIAMPGGNDPDNRRDFPGGWPGDARSAFDSAGRTADEQRTWSHVQRLLRLRRERADLRTARTEHLVATEQQFVYRRGRTVVALNNDTKPAEVRLPAATTTLGADALGMCAAPRREGVELVVTIPARAGCIF